MVLKRSLGELKYFPAQAGKYDPILEESICALQQPKILELVYGITGLHAPKPDELLYAGGTSTMAHDHFLNPHVDNSHHKFRQRCGIPNLLSYVSPAWSEADGCNLEFWPDGPKAKPVTIVSRFNRLVAMVTHRGSWYSVSRSLAHNDRYCVSNYYFSTEPIGGTDYFYVTRFRGRPEQPVCDLVLRTDVWLRMTIRKVFPQGIGENRHFYDKSHNDRAN